MSTGADGWVELAHAVTTCPDRGTADRVAAAAPHLGLTEEERAALGAAVTGREDPAGRYLREVVDHAPGRADEAATTPPGPSPFDEAAMERALDLADALERTPASLGGPGSQDGRSVLGLLEALPAQRAGTLVLALVVHGGPAALEVAVAVAERAPATRMPVEDLLQAAGQVPEDDLGALAAVLARVPRGRLLGALATVLDRAPHPVLARLVELLADRQGGEQAVGAEPPSTGGEPPSTGAEPPTGGEAPTAGSPARADAPVYRGAPPAPGPPLETAVGAQDGADDGRVPAHPRIDLRTGTARPDVVVVDQPFTVTVGLGPRPSHGIVATGLAVAPGPVDVVLTYDPDSLHLDGPERHPLVVTAADPHPTVDVTVTARYLQDEPATRRIGVHYLQGGQVVGVAWRRFVAVDEESLVAAAPAPPTTEGDLLDLSPLLDESAPDLILAVCRADTGKGDRWVWSTYAADPALPVTDAPDVATLDGEVVGFATATRRAVQFSPNPLSDHLTLAGRAHRIGASMPPAVHEALASVVAAAAARGPDATAPTLLLLTEELVVPWELATPQPRLQTPWGGTSPFLGAHVAVGRWPLTDRSPRPVPRTSVDVRTAAVVTADYTGVPGWGRLEAALAEADEVSGLFTPPATRVDPDLTQVIDLLRGVPPADVVHMALHGQFDAEGEQEGIVLLDRSPEGAVRPQFLTAVQLETGMLTAGPFVFLNACQVGSDERVLGGYGGFASTLLRIGASGVVAPLWNIDDVVAAEVARDVYAATLGPAGATDGEGLVAVAEALRRVRARYTEEAVRAGTPGVGATLVAFQVFAHPRLRLRRAG